MALKKVTMGLSEKSVSNIDFINTHVKETNRTRVVALALEITKHIVEEVKQNEGELMLKYKDGSMHIIKLMF